MRSHEMTGCKSHAESTGVENDLLSISHVSCCPHVTMAQNISSDSSEGSSICSDEFFFVRKGKRNFSDSSDTSSSLNKSTEGNCSDATSKAHSSSDSCSSDDSQNSEECAIIKTPGKRKCPGPANNEFQTCALPEEATPALKKFVKRGLVTSQMTVMKAQTTCTR